MSDGPRSPRLTLADPEGKLTLKYYLARLVYGWQVAVVRAHHDNQRMQSRFLTSPYSPTTWEAARVAFDNKQTAFARSKYASARKVVERGSIFLCYVIGAKEIVAALQANSDPYLAENDPTRGLLLYPVRVDTLVVARCELGSGISLAEIKDQSSDPDRWIGLVQGALKRVPKSDGDWIVSELRKRSKATSATP